MIHKETVYFHTGANKLPPLRSPIDSSHRPRPLVIFLPGVAVFYIPSNTQIMATFSSLPLEIPIEPQNSGKQRYHRHLPHFEMGERLIYIFTSSISPCQPATRSIWCNLLNWSTIPPNDGWTQVTTAVFSKIAEPLSGHGPVHLFSTTTTTAVFRMKSGGVRCSRFRMFQLCIWAQEISLIVRQYRRSNCSGPHAIQSSEVDSQCSQSSEQRFSTSFSIWSRDPSSNASLKINTRVKTYSLLWSYH